MKYGNGAETNYTYNTYNRRMDNLKVNMGTNNIMNNAYTYDAVSNVTKVENTGTTANYMGGGMTHNYSYDNLYRLKSANGTFTGYNGKTANYTLGMGYDNMHNITSKKQTITQNNVQFTGLLKAGYNLSYQYADNSQQISNIADSSYRTEGTAVISPIAKSQSCGYDANGNLIYVNTGTKTTDGKLQATNNRKLLWDEENRLLALSDNGFVSNYLYDAAGERTVKESGDGEGVSVNGVLSGARIGTTNFTAYINPYLVVNNGGYYSKHIYIGSQRIMSKLGSSDIFAASPLSRAKAGSKDFTAKYADLTGKIKNRYDSLGVTYSGTDNAGAGMITSTAGRIPTPVEYYFHSDHLGSSSLITDGSGDVVQHLEYIPFGEVFVDERHSTWSTPYKFNAKELDEETGLYYYGARYYDPRTSVWISVDPLAEKYPNVSSYVFCLNNPVRLIDPDGRGVKDRVAAARSMLGIPYRKEQGGLRTANTNSATEFMDCSELVSRVMTADNITKSGTGFNSSSMRSYLDNSDKFEHSSSPQVGDIAVWKGHVAVVTGVYEDGKIDVVMARGKGRSSKEIKSSTSQNLNPNTFYGYYHPINETPDGKLGNSTQAQSGTTGNNNASSTQSSFNQGPPQTLGDKMMDSKIPIVNDLGRLAKKIGL